MQYEFPIYKTWTDIHIMELLGAMCINRVQCDVKTSKVCGSIRVS